MKRSSTQHAVHRKLQEKQYFGIIMPPPPITPPGHRRAQSPVAGRQDHRNRCLRFRSLPPWMTNPWNWTLKQKAEAAPPRKLTIRGIDRITHKAASTLLSTTIQRVAKMITFCDGLRIKAAGVYNETNENMENNRSISQTTQHLQRPWSKERCASCAISAKRPD